MTSSPERTDGGWPVDRGLVAAGAYVPRYRIDTSEIRSAWGTLDAPGVERKAVPAADEDALTMAVAAGERALSRAGIEPDAVTFLGVASTTPPLDEEAIAPRVARALRLGDDVATRSHTQSTLGGAHVLEDAVASTGPALAIAADAPAGDPGDADHAFGAGAVAFLVDEEPRARLVDLSRHSGDYPGIRYRERGSRDVESLDVTTYERTAVHESVTTAIERLSIDSDGVDAASVYQPDGRTPYRAAGGIVDSDAIGRGMVVDRIGDAGAAGVGLGLLSALHGRDASDTTIAAWFAGGGGAVVAAFEGGLEADVRESLDGGSTLSYPEYLRVRGHVGRTEVAGGGAHVSLPTWQRSIDQRYRLRAGRCPDCDALAFPPEGACPDCHGRVPFDPVDLPGVGTVVARTTIQTGGAPPEFAEHQRREGSFDVALVEIDADGDSVTVPAQITDAESGSVSLGDEVVAVIRRIYEQEGVPRYGTKFRPTTESD